MRSTAPILPSTVYHFLSCSMYPPSLAPSPYPSAPDLSDAPFFEWLEANMDRLLARDPEAIAYAVERSCINKVGRRAGQESGEEGGGEEGWGGGREEGRR